MLESYEMSNHSSYIDLMCNHDEVERVNFHRQFGYYKDDIGIADTDQTFLDDPTTCKCARLVCSMVDCGNCGKWRCSDCGLWAIKNLIYEFCPRCLCLQYTLPDVATTGSDKGIMTLEDMKKLTV